MDEVRKIYVSVKTGDIRELRNFFEIYDNISVANIGEKCLGISVSESFDLNDLQNMREIAIEEFYVDFTAFVSPRGFDTFVTGILEILPELNPGVYKIENLIPEIIILNKTKLKLNLKNFYYTLTNQETINTVLGFIDSNMNASGASKKLYMHRNTLNYRLDHFVEKTEINIREFAGAMAIYLLFRR